MNKLETIDKCIKLISGELESYKSVKDNKEYFDKYSPFGKMNDADIEEIDEEIIVNQKHLDNLYSIKKELNYGK